MRKEDPHIFAENTEDPEKFLDKNKDLKQMTPYRKLMLDEKKPYASRILSAIWLVYDPKSPFVISGRDEDETKEEVKETLFGDDTDFTWRKYEKYSDAYRLDCRNPIERQLDKWHRRIREREIFIDELDWETHATQKDAMLEKSDKLYSNYMKVYEKLEKERQEQRYYGGSQKSFLEELGD